MNQKNIKTYSKLISFKTFEDRFEYLKLNGKVADETFGCDRYLNQIFYKTKEWRNIRNYIIFRDNGCDLGISDREILDEIILIHHLNPITKEDILNRSKFLLDPEYLICTTDNTHKAIHYGDSNLLSKQNFIERYKYDTCPWRHR